MICPACDHENLEGADICEACMADLTSLDTPQPTDPVQQHLLTSQVRIHQKLDRQGKLVTVTLETPVKTAIDLMRKHRIGAILVLDGEKLAGIFTERDILYRIMKDEAKWLQSPIAEVMTPDPAVLDADDVLAFAVHKMCVGGFRHIPIVSEGKPIGILSIREVLHHLCEVAW
ncbi:MAG: CBS domain-containing protein [Deltaproteobacteria bacterium]|nr:MAG: CBS domain-containing protein [Deltaproteobacteria bacterium]